MIKIVEKGFENRREGIKITDAVLNTELFRSITLGDVYALARIAKVVEYKAEEVIVKKDADAEKIYILLEGEAEVRDGDKVLSTLKDGHIFGELAIVEKIKRTADVVLTKDCKIIEIIIDELNPLLENRPRLGFSVAKNLAKSISAKLRKSN